MNGSFCSIVTPDYLENALALERSLSRFGQYQYFVFVTCPSTDKRIHSLSLPSNVHIVSVETLCAAGLGAKLYDAYVPRNELDAFRWSMKPVFMDYLLDKVPEIICIDVDFMFFSSPEVLFQELHHCAVLLCPHWRCSDPEHDVGNFGKIFREGYFNGGLTGATAAGRDALRWWAEACLYKCRKNGAEGLFDDQRYLDFIPFEFPDVRILEHRGINLAEWNIDKVAFDVNPDGSIMINHKWPLVCIHFASLAHLIAKVGEGPLKPCVEQYLAAHS